MIPDVGQTLEGGVDRPRAWRLVTASCAPSHRLIDPFHRKERFGENASGSPAYLAAKAKGDNSMP